MVQKMQKITQHIFDDNIHADLLINFKNIFETYTSDIKFKKLKVTIIFML